MERIEISQFRSACVSVVEGVGRSGPPVLITRRGEPVARIVPALGRRPEKRRLGALAGTTRIVGDVISPVTSESIDPD